MALTTNEITCCGVSAALSVGATTTVNPAVNWEANLEAKEVNLVLEAKEAVLVHLNSMSEADTGGVFAVVALVGVDSVVEAKGMELAFKCETFGFAAVSGIKGYEGYFESGKDSTNPWKTNDITVWEVDAIAKADLMVVEASVVRAKMEVNVNLTKPVEASMADAKSEVVSALAKADVVEASVVRAKMEVNVNLAKPVEASVADARSDVVDAKSDVVDAKSEVVSAFANAMVKAETVVDLQQPKQALGTTT
ncbi:hypothetical protein M378DRAFT_25272 [Amanita muscaria Koide BX008]|uniref:Uncharacterized protein n=1 Tax=Amanita muscaria (strain Koide BX008) TaxID=946122 RepID=A0A0C2T8V8_AMAMK|nr:hypothetical protein M378DRAFT_25272 [Amanita muscaria Koide BX008]